MFILKETAIKTKLPYTIGSSPYEKEGQPCEVIIVGWTDRGTNYQLEVVTKAGSKELNFDDKQDAIRSGWKI